MLVRRSNEGENLYRKTIIHKNIDNKSRLFRWRRDKNWGEFSKWTSFFFFMNVKHLPIHIFSFFATQIDSKEKLGGQFLSTHRWFTLYIHMHNLLRDEQTYELLHTHKYIWATPVMGSKQQSALIYNNFHKLPTYRSQISEHWVQ